MSSLKIDRLQLDIIINNDVSRKRLLELEDSMKKVRAEMKRLPKDSEEWKKLDAQLKKLQGEFDQLQDSIGITGLTMKELQAKSRELKMILDRLDPRTPQWKQYNEQLQAVKARMAELNGTAKVTSLTFSKMADGFNRYFGMIGAFVASFAGIVIGARKAVDEFNKFEQSLANLSALTGLAGDDLNWLGEEAKRLSIGTTESGIKITKSATDILEAYKLMGSAKPELLKNKEALAEVTEMALILAEAASMETGPAVESLASIMNQFGAGSDQAAEYINILAAGSKEGAAEVQDLADSIIRSGAAAKSANISIEQEVALIEALAEKGIKAERAGTGLRGVILKLQKGADEFNPAIVGIDQALQNLADANMSTAELMKIFGEESYTVGKILIDQRDRVKDLTLAVTDTNVAFEQANVNTSTNSAKLEQAKNKAKLYAIELGEKLAPVMTFSTNVMGKFLRVLSAAIDFYRENARWINTAIAAIAAYTVVVNAATVAQKAYKLAADLSNFATEKLSKAIKANPFGLIAAAVAGVVTAVQKYKSTNDQLNESIKHTQATIEIEKRSMNELFDKLVQLNPKSAEAKELRDKLNDTYKEYLPNLITEKDTIEQIKNYQQQANDELTKSIVLKAKEQEINDELTDVYEDMVDAGKEVIKGLQDSFGLTYEQAAKVYSNFVKETRQNISGLQEEFNNKDTYGIALLNNLMKEYTNAESIYVNMSNSMKTGARDVNSLLHREHNTITEISAAYDALLPKINAVNNAQNNIPDDFDGPGNGGSGKGDFDQMAWFLAAESNRMINSLTEVRRKAGQDVSLFSEELELNEADVNAAILDGKRMLADKEWELENDKAAKLQKLYDEGKVGYKQYMDEMAKIALEQYRLMGLSAEQLISTAENVGSSIGQVIGETLSGSEDAWKNFGKSMVNTLLQTVETILVQMIAQSMAQPDSVATFGATGVARYVAMMALTKAGFAAAKSFVSSVQFADGNLYEVLGAQDGKAYKAGWEPFSSNKIYNRPTLLGNKLVGEAGPELVLNAPTTRNLYFNYPELANALRSVYVPQYASGNLPAPVGNDNTQMLEMVLAMMAKLNKRLDEPIHADVSWMDIKKKSDQFSKITRTSSGQ